MLLLNFSVISYCMLYVLWIFSMAGMFILNFLNGWYVYTEFSHLLAMLLLFIISVYSTVYIENNIFIIQLFLITWESGLLFKLCLKGSLRMYLLHVLKIWWMFVKNVHKKKSSVLSSKFDARRRLKCRILHHLPQSFWRLERPPDPCRNTTSLREVGDSLC